MFSHIEEAIKFRGVDASWRLPCRRVIPRSWRERLTRSSAIRSGGGVWAKPRDDDTGTRGVEIPTRCTSLQTKGAHMATKIEIVHWDGTEEPDTDWINEGLQAVFDGKHCPFIRNVPDTGGEFGVAVASQPITTDEAQQAWDRFMAELTGETKKA